MLSKAYHYDLRVNKPLYTVSWHFSVKTLIETGPDMLNKEVGQIFLQGISFDMVLLLFHCGNWQFPSMLYNEQNAFISLLGITAQIIIHHYNPQEISFPTIYNVTGLSSTKSKLHLFASLITVKYSINFMSVS